MKLLAQLPRDREAPGTLVVLDVAGAVIAGPFRCRGEADNAAAAKADNVQEAPTRAFGDHPYGSCRVGEIVDIPEKDVKGRKAYGPHFIRLSPVSGEALEGWTKGRRGVGLHGGALDAQGRLRVTYGCLRVDDDTLEAIVKLLRERAAERDTFYHCEPLAA